MSAPNQIQQNNQPGSYYLDQYSQKTFTMQGRVAGVSGSGVFNTIFNFHKQGNLVMVTIHSSGINVGTDTNLDNYYAASVIPTDCIPAAQQQTSAVALVTGAIFTMVTLQFNSDGSIQVKPAGTATFPAAMYLSGNSCFYYKV